MIGLILQIAVALTPTPTTGIEWRGSEHALNPSDIIFWDSGEEILRLEKGGTIKVAHPEKLDETARKFIEMVKQIYPEICEGRHDQ